MATPDLPADDVFLPGGLLRFDLLTEPAAQAIRDVESGKANLADRYQFTANERWIDSIEITNFSLSSCSSTPSSPCRQPPRMRTRCPTRTNG